jgi:hypothetical protein
MMSICVSGATCELQSQLFGAPGHAPDGFDARLA